MTILTPDQRLRVFISSTLGELAPERAVVRDVIERLRLQPVMFEMGARPHPPRALYRAYLEQSAIFVGLYWERYGWTAEDMEISGLEDEYRLSGRMPRLLYVKEPAPDREPRLSAMIEKMAALPDVQPRVFATAAELAEMVADDLVLLLSQGFSREARGHAAVQPAAASPPAHDALPAPLTSFVGRSREVAEVRALLRRDDVRLVTLAGMGGMGKTRLALEVARGLEDDFADGVHLVRLAAVAQAELVIPTIASALGIRIEERTAADAGLVEALAGRKMLLILDNMEQVADAAPAIGDLLAAAPDLKILATSRRLLRIAAEHEYQVPTMTLPVRDGATRPEEIAETEAVQLFVDRASAVRPDFRLTEDDADAVAAIVRRVDGVPLAIELAAARVRLLPPAALLARLDRAVDVLAGGLADLPERQRSLRATLDWSYSLLDPVDQLFLARLSTFAGGWTLEAAEEICAGDGVAAGEVLDRLAALADNCLVIVELSDATSQARFRMLEPVREYARERLVESGDAEHVDRRHLEHFTTLAAQASVALRGHDQPRWLDVLEQEAGNLNAAAARGLSWREPQRLVDMAWHIWVWLWLNDHVTEARHWLEPVYAQRDHLQPLHRARLDWVLGSLFFEHGDFDRAGPLLHASVAEFTELGDEEGRGLALLIAGAVLPYEGDDTTSEAYLTQANELLRAQGDHFSAALACGSLGMHLVRVGDIDTGEALMEEALRDARLLNNAPMTAQIKLYSSFAAVARGDLGRSRALLEEVIETSGGRRSDEVLAYGFEGLAGVALLEGDAARAATLLGIAAGIRQRAANAVWPDMKPLIDGLIEGSRALLGEERFTIAWDAGRTLTRDAARSFARTTVAAAPAAEMSKPPASP